MVVREHGLAAANVFGRCGAAIAPLFAFLQFQLRSSFVPLLVLGCMCLAAGVLAGILRPSSASQAAQRALPSQQEEAYSLPSQRSV